MSICPVTYDLNNYLDKQEEALAEFTSCLPEYRDKVANEVVALFDGKKSEEEFWAVFYEWSAEEDQYLVLDKVGEYQESHQAPSNSSFFRILVITALEYYSEVLYNCSLDEMLEDNDGTTLESWIESVL